MIHRRTILKTGALAGLGATLGARTAFAATPASPFAGTMLETNRLARRFTPLDTPLPRIALKTATGATTLAGLTGKTRLVTLWAEWCAPCIAEARDFAELNRAFAGPSFEIVSILTSSSAKLDYRGARARLDQAQAAGLPLLVEADGGKRVAEAFSPTPGTSDLPCTLLVDRRGRVRGRMLGAVMISTGGSPPAAMRRGPDGKPLPMVLTEAQKQALLGQRSLWASPTGKALVAGLRDGVLE